MLINAWMKFQQNILKIQKNDINIFQIYYYSAAWKVIKSWLSPQAVAKMKFTSKSDIQMYIDKDKLLERMGGTVSKYLGYDMDVLETVLYQNFTQFNICLLVFVWWFKFHNIHVLRELCFTLLI